MTHKLKSGQPAFESVDGPFAGRRFVPDFVYAEIPPGEEHRFERADKATVTQIPNRGKAAAKAPIENERA
jgi:hypothetical protein